MKKKINQEKHLLDLFDIFDYFSKLNLLTKSLIISIPIIFAFISIIVYDELITSSKQTRAEINRLSQNDFNFNKSFFHDFNEKILKNSKVESLLDGFYKEIVFSNKNIPLMKNFFDKQKQNKNLDLMSVDEFINSITVKVETEYEFHIFFNHNVLLDGRSVLKEYIEFVLDYSANRLFRNMELNTLNLLESDKRSYNSMKQIIN